MRNRLLMFGISLLCLVFIMSLVNSIRSLWEKGGIISQRQAVLTEKQGEFSELKEKLSYVQSPRFIEKEARDKLNLSRQGEIVVVVPETGTPQAIENQPRNELPNWQQWLKLFF